ncbi:MULTISPECIES: hypothetical protein [Helcococcus]|uniref:Uncharacterized protein n=1 Tax=Helcococcus bovis TaxID=3153252 RepID=A0ABW9F7I3_9FIRM
MNKTKKIYIRLISFLLALFIIFTGLGQIYAKKLFKSPENNKVSGKFFNNIIEKEFEDAFNKTDYVEYIITMKKKPEIKNDSKSHEVVQKTFRYCIRRLGRYYRGNKKGSQKW